MTPGERLIEQARAISYGQMRKHVLRCCIAASQRTLDTPMPAGTRATMVQDIALKNIHDAKRTIEYINGMLAVEACDMAIVREIYEA